MIYFENVSKIYNCNGSSDPCVALDSINLRIRPQEFISLAGPSGAGKSTLLKLLIGEEKPTEGKVMLDNQNLNLVSLKTLPEIRRKIGMVFQDFRLLANRTAYENVAFAMEAAGDSHQEIGQDVPQVLDVVGLADKRDYFPHQLFGREKNRM